MLIDNAVYSARVIHPHLPGPKSVREDAATAGTYMVILERDLRGARYVRVVWSRRRIGHLVDRLTRASLSPPS
jgi:hypothetical protein